MQKSILVFFVISLFLSACGIGILCMVFFCQPHDSVTESEVNYVIMFGTILAIAPITFGSIIVICEEENNSNIVLRDKVFTFRDE